MNARQRAELDAVADSIKAQLNTGRREAEEEGFFLMCAERTCARKAEPNSCYCSQCEAEIYGEMSDD